MLTSQFTLAFHEFHETDSGNFSRKTSFNALFFQLHNHHSVSARCSSIFLRRSFCIYFIIAGNIPLMRKKIFIGNPATVNSGMEILNSSLTSSMALFILSTLRCSPTRLRKCLVLPVITISFLSSQQIERYRQSGIAMRRHWYSSAIA